MDGMSPGVAGGQGSRCMARDEAEKADTMQVQVLEGFAVSGES